MKKIYQIDFPSSGGGHAYDYVECDLSELRLNVRNIVEHKANMGIFFNRAVIREYDKDKKKALDIVMRVNKTEMLILRKYR